MKTDDTSLLNKLTAASIQHDGWMHACPKGDHPYYFDEADESTWHDGHKNIVQVIDDEACRLMAASYPLSQEDALVDFEHDSITADKSTRGAGWGKEAQVRNDGLWARAEWTPSGQAAVDGKELRFNSPCFPRSGLVHIDGNRYRPTKLGRIALTNNPNLRGQKPLTNSRLDTPANPTKRTHTMDLKALLLSLLGLPADATDQQIETAAAALKGDKSQMTANTTRISELETQLANTDLDAHGIKDEAQRKFFTPLLTNKDQRPEALKTLGALKAKPVAPPLHNKANARVPNVTEQLSAEGDEAEKATEALHNRARQYRDTHKVPYETALNAVRSNPKAE